jgi:hypothetical protein
MKTKKTIIGRSREQEVFKELLTSTKAEFLALYGRRRVGKTYLVTRFFEKEAGIFFYTSGLQEGTLQEQLRQFYKQIGMTFYHGAAISERQRWMDAFDDMTKAMQQVPANKKIILFFDEFPWMATKRSRLLQALDYYWNRHWSHDGRIKLIICGSSASWIIEKIINNKGGLYNRVTRTMQLYPFTLYETKLFLNSMGVKLNQRHILDLYMVLGGIPHYLGFVRKGLSAHQCISELCFQKDGALVKEFDRLFASLFQESESYINLINTIAKNRNGIGQSSLIKESGEPEGGRTVSRLKELEEAGFIVSFLPYGHQDKGIYYKIYDEYILFYLHWIKPNLATIRRQERTNDYWLSKIKSPGWQSWSGYAFEAICFKQHAQIRKSLGIDAGAEIATWRYVAKEKQDQGAQIDLLFDRHDGAITICEIKYNDHPFAIDKQYSKNLLNKVEVYKKHTKTNKQIFLAMITAYGLKPSMYSEELITGQVSMDDLFQK